MGECESAYSFQRSKSLSLRVHQLKLTTQAGWVLLVLTGGPPLRLLLWETYSGRCYGRPTQADVMGDLLRPMLWGTYSGRCYGTYSVAIRSYYPLRCYGTYSVAMGVAMGVESTLTHDVRPPRVGGQHLFTFRSPVRYVVRCPLVSAEKKPVPRPLCTTYIL